MINRHSVNAGNSGSAFTAVSVTHSAVSSDMSSVATASEQGKVCQGLSVWGGAFLEYLGGSLHRGSVGAHVEQGASRWIVCL